MSIYYNNNIKQKGAYVLVCIGDDDRLQFTI